MSIKGYGSNKKLGDQKYVTLQDVGSGKTGIDMLPKALYPVQLLPFVTVSGTTDTVEAVGVGAIARAGDVVRITTGSNAGMELSIISNTGDILELGHKLDVAMAASDEFLLMRHITLTITSNGSLVTSQGPLEYILDGLSEQVEQDTVVPANNRSLPVGITIEKDGVTLPINKDTGNPSNTVAVPVEIVAAVGTPINISAGDINIQTTHLGANADSMRIGNGVNELGINASNEALVKDTDAASFLSDILAATATLMTEATGLSLGTGLDDILTELEAKANLTETQPVSLASQPLPTGAATEVTLAAILSKILAAPSTEAKQDTAILALGSLLTELQLKADLSETQPVSAASLPLPTGAATAVNQSNEITALGNLLTELQLKADLTETQPVSAASLPLPTGASTSANQTTANNSLSQILTQVYRLSIVDQVDGNMISIQSSNIPASSGGYLTIVASLTADTRRIKVIEDIGEFIGLYDGSNNFLCVLPQGFTGGEMDIAIPAGTLLKIRNMKNTTIATDTRLAISFLG